MDVLALLKVVPIRYWEYLGLAIALVVGVLWYNGHERAIGREALEAQIKAAQDKAQAQIDALSDKQNKDIQVRYNGIAFDPVAPIDLKLPADCGAVPDAVRVRINAAHKAGKR